MTKIPTSHSYKESAKVSMFTHPICFQKKRSNHDFHSALRELSENEPYRSTTAYPHPKTSSPADDLAYGQAYGPQFSSLAYMLPPTDLYHPGSKMMRSCEVHAFPGAPYMRHPAIGRESSCANGIHILGHACTYILCCGSKGLLSKFPSRAKRIDVISRFVFPLIFAIFNLSYWLFYLFAKSKSPQLENE